MRKKGEKERKLCRRICGITAILVVVALVAGSIGFKMLQEEDYVGVSDFVPPSLKADVTGEDENLYVSDMEKGGAEPKEYQVKAVTYPEPVDIWEDEDWEPNGAYLKNLKSFYTNTLQKMLMNEKGESVVCSPVNLYLCMAMLTEMTNGETQKQLLEALGQKSVIDVRKQSQKIWHCLYEDNDISKCVLGNSLWLNENIGFEQNVLEILANNYYASTYQGEMGSEDFDKTIQKWVNSMTGDALEEQTDGIKTQPDMAALLYSTAYFYDQWATTFRKELTKEGKFYNRNGSESICDFMKQTKSSEYIYHTEDFFVTSLSFEHGKEMYLFLPKQGVSVEEILQKDMKEILHICSGAQKEEEDAEWAEVTIKLPKFEITTSKYDLIPVLQQMGVEDLFKVESADFTKLLGEAADEAYQIFVNRVEQSTRIAVDEIGCSVASYTEVGMKCGAALPKKHYTLNYNRPFLFVISDNYTGIPVFSGVVNAME